MPKRKISPYLVGGAVLVLALLVWAILSRTGQAPVTTPKEDPGLTLSMHSMTEVPQVVAEAAKVLQNSEVGYAMVAEGKTYLIISTGRDSVKITAERVVAEPDELSPSLVDIHLKSDPQGASLLIGSLPLAGATRYQFPLDGMYAVIPALYNPHGLPLTDLPRTGGFTLVAPLADAMVEGRVLSIGGYARVFESGFMATLVADDGTLLKDMGIHAAAGAPDWGSFLAEMDLAGVKLPERGKLILTDALTGARYELPLRFLPPIQLG